MAAADWAGLHIGLVGEICAFLGDTSSLLSFAATCSGWREGVGEALGCCCFWKRLNDFCINKAKRRAAADSRRSPGIDDPSAAATDPSGARDPAAAAAAAAGEAPAAAAAGGAPARPLTRRGQRAGGPTPEALLLQPLLLLQRLPHLQRLRLEVPGQGPELGAFLGCVCPSLKEVTLATRRGLTNAEVQQLCQQMPLLQTLDIKIQPRAAAAAAAAAAAGGGAHARLARHSVHRGGPPGGLQGEGAPGGGPHGAAAQGAPGGPRGPHPLRGIKRYLKLWTEVKRLSVVTCDEAGAPLGPLGGPAGATVAEIYAT